LAIRRSRRGSVGPDSRHTFQLSEDRTLWEEAKDTVDRLKMGASVLKLAKFITTTAITMTPDINGFIDCFKEESEKVADTMENFEKDFEKLLQQMKVGTNRRFHRRSGTVAQAAK
jgi:hypothetical protein